MKTTKPVGLYRLAAIYPTEVSSNPLTNGMISYGEAYAKAIRFMKLNQHIVAMLIYSENTQIIIKRKWINDETQ